MNKDMSNDEYLEFLNIINTLPKKEYEIIRRGVLQLNDDKKELFNEISRLNNIINKLEKWLSEFETKEFNYNFLVVRVKDIQDKLKELKEEGK